MSPHLFDLLAWVWFRIKYHPCRWCGEPHQTPSLPHPPGLLLSFSCPCSQTRVWPAPRLRPFILQMFPLFPNLPTTSKSQEKCLPSSSPVNRYRFYHPSLSCISADQKEREHHVGRVLLILYLATCRQPYYIFGLIPCKP